METDLLMDVNSENQKEEDQRSYSYDGLTREELVEKCNKFLDLARKAKKSKDEALRENELMKRELKELRGVNYDLELEIQILKRDVMYPKDEDVNLLSELPTIRNDKPDNQRIGCLWRFNKLFRE